MDVQVGECVLAPIKTGKEHVCVRNDILARLKKEFATDEYNENTARSGMRRQVKTALHSQTRQQIRCLHVAWLRYSTPLVLGTSR